MTMLSTIQYFCRRQNLPVPSTVYGSTDTQVLQMLAILEEEGADLSGRGDWQGLTREATHTTVATESQGAITSIATDNFRYIKTDTFWDRTEILPVYVINGPEWQQVKAISVTGPRHQVRLRNNLLISNPVPPAGNTWAFEYVSWNWILDNDGTTTKQYFTEDTDTFLLPDTIILQGLRWRWKKEKGMEYAEDFMTYEKMVADALSRDNIKGPVNMGRREYKPRPSVFIPDGNWI